MRNTILTLNLGEKPLKINLDNYQSDKVYDLFEKVAQIRIKHSAYGKFSRNEGETNEEWRERIAKEAEKESVRLDGEELDTYLKRVFDAKHEMYLIAFDVLNAICEVFGQATVSEERFKAANWLAVKKFIYDILTLGDIPANDFYTEPLK